VRLSGSVPAFGIVAAALTFLSPWPSRALAPEALAKGAQSPDDAPVRVAIEDLLRAPGRYDQRTVLVKARLRGGDMEDQGNEIYELSDLDSFRSVRTKMPWGSMNDMRFLEGSTVEVVGVFWDLSSQDPRFPDPRLRAYPGILRNDTQTNMDEKYRYFIAATSLERVEDQPPLKPEPKPDRPSPPKKDLPAATSMDLRELVKSAEAVSDKRIEVVGKFRGDNLYGDLPIRSKRAPRDFVLKAATASIWVTGRRPRGDDFELDPRMRRDTGKWLKVSGVARLEDGVVYLKADTIELGSKPDDPELEPRDVEAKTEDAPKVQPEVVFSLPLEGERGIPLTTEFRIQFSKDMNDASFDRNVDLLYADDTGRGNPFPDMKIVYDRPSRTLVVSPGHALAPQKEIRLVLYRHIVDREGLPLAVRKDAKADVAEAAVVLSFFSAER